jgi:hypothetical protein
MFAADAFLAKLALDSLLDIFAFIITDDKFCSNLTILPCLDNRL